MSDQPASFPNSQDITECADGRYFSSIRALRDVYDRVLEFLKRNHGHKLREVMDAEIDISDMMQ